MEFLFIFLPIRHVFSTLKNTLAVQFKNRLTPLIDLNSGKESKTGVTPFYKPLYHQRNLALGKHFENSLWIINTVFFIRQMQNGALWSINLAPKSFPLGTMDCVIKLKLKIESFSPPFFFVSVRKAMSCVPMWDIRAGEEGSSSLLANIQCAFLAPSSFATPELWEQTTIWVLWREPWILFCVIHWGN